MSSHASSPSISGLPSDVLVPAELGASNQFVSPHLAKPSTGGDQSFPSSDAQLHANSQSRLEQLIEQQITLLQRQLELAEESRKSSESACFHKEPHHFLRTLDPNVRKLFAAWHKEFSAKVSLYVCQSRLAEKYNANASQGELMKPLVDEAQKPWHWPEFYRLVAEPIEGVDQDHLASPRVGSLDEVSGQSEGFPSADVSPSYSIDAAFTGLRLRHAWELQNFIICHQKDCLQKIIDELALPNQVRNLQEKLAAWIAVHGDLHNARSKEILDDQAKKFVEVVYTGEMTNAKKKITDGELSAPMCSTACLRAACIILLVLAITTMSYELLMRMLAVMFALVCGMALLWEDKVLCCLHLLLGESIKRLRVLGTLPVWMMRQAPMVNIPVMIG